MQGGFDSRVRPTWLCHPMALPGTTGSNQEIGIDSQYRVVTEFSEQPPKLGVARSNRARVTILSFEIFGSCVIDISHTTVSIGDHSDHLVTTLTKRGKSHVTFSRDEVGVLGGRESRTVVSQLIADELEVLASLQCKTRKRMPRRVEGPVFRHPALRGHLADDLDLLVDIALEQWGPIPGCKNPTV